MDLDVVVEDVRDSAARAGLHGCGCSGVSLDVDGLDRVVELVVQELNTIDTGILITGSDGADTQTRAKPYVHVTNDNV